MTESFRSQTPPDAVEAVADRILRGDIRALSRCISAVENGDPRASEIVEQLQAKAGRAWVIGLTGVPGAGKSTLVSSLAQRLSVKGARPAILAVDPSSSISGGALLGDRIRDQSDTQAIYFRSMATRGSLGGLSGSLDDVVTLLDAAGRDVILIETVGTGQSEIDVTRVAHTTVAVTAPGLGDEIQAMKAGITEVADLHVVNKADADAAGAETAALLLRQRLRDKAGAAALDEGANPATSHSPATWLAPVRVVSARTGAGLDELLESIEAHRKFLEETDGLRAWRRRRVVARYRLATRDALQARLLSEWRERLEQDEEAVAEGRITAVRAAQRLVSDALPSHPHSNAGSDDWRQRHAEELAKTWKPRFITSSGIDIKPVYAPSDLEAQGWTYDKDCGMPGDPPWTRGFSAGGYRERLWEIEMYAGFGSAEEANKRYHYLLNHGSTGGVSIALDLPTQIGLDPDHPLAQDEVGQVGVALSSLQDVETIFDGIPLARAGHVFSTANSIGPIAIAWFLALVEKKGASVADFTLQIQNDSIKEYVARGTQFLPIEAAVKLSIDAVEYVAQHVPNWLPISISGSHMKQAGATTVQEAAFTICNGIAYVEQCLARGMQIDDFGDMIELHFCTEMDFFEEVAKYRSVRKVWTELVRTRFGGTTEKAQRFRLHAATSGRPLTAQQTLNNISRITLQALAQVLGGCEQTRTASFDEALGIPTELAARTSIRVNQVIGHETGIPYTVDPLGGSYYVESLTKEFERQIWETIRTVDKLGGAVGAVKSGWYQQHIAESAYGQQRRIETKEDVVVGVNEFKVDEPDPPQVFKVRADVAARQMAKVSALRNSRQPHAVQEALDALKRDCLAGLNVMPATLAAVKAYATVGEIAAVWREVFGNYVPQTERF